MDHRKINHYCHKQLKCVKCDTFKGTFSIQSLVKIIFSFLIV